MTRLKPIARADQISMLKDSGTDEKQARDKEGPGPNFVAAPSPET